jgi:hypothetical protein
MTLEELLSNDASVIRKNEELMNLFIHYYKEVFSYIPSCVGCSFKRSYRKLKKFSQNGEKTLPLIKMQKQKKMKNSFLLKKSERLKIHSYTKNGVKYRRYGNAIDEAFARELVAAGKSDIFLKLPDMGEEGKYKVELHLKDGTKEIYGIEEGLEVSEYKKPYKEMNYHKELLPLYKEVSQRVGKQAKSNRKDDVLAFLRENE